MNLQTGYMHDTLSNWDLEKTIEDAKQETDTMQNLLDSINNPAATQQDSISLAASAPQKNGGTLDQELQRLMA